MFVCRLVKSVELVVELGVELVVIVTVFTVYLVKNEEKQGHF